MERENYIRSRLNNVQFIYQKECEWNRIKLSLNFHSNISPILVENKIRTDQMVNLLNDGKLYGFALVDLEATELAQKFRTINWPPILRKFEVTFDMIPEWMQSKMSPKTFPRKTLVQTMNAKEVLVHTKLLSFYIKHGFIIVKLHRFFEFEGAPALKNVYSNVYEARVSATDTGDDTKATAVKLVSNSMYGQMLMVNIKH